MMTEVSGLEVDNLGVKYGKAIAVEGVSFTLVPGTTTALVGLNGAGKSSILHALVGSVRGASGHVRIDDESIDGLKPNARTEKGISLVPQGRHVFKSLSVQENLAVIADSQKLDRSVIGVALDRFPILRERRKVHAGMLSGGEQQMLAIARALMPSPEILLLDEPALGLAPGIVDELMEAVVSVAASDSAVLIAEPSTATLRTHIDHGIVLQRGQIVARCDGDDLTDTYHRALGMHV